MISYDEAMAILHKANPLETIELPVQEACGYVLAEKIESTVQVPPFANSAMDGFAVRAQDIANATENSPISLPIAGSTVAGDQPSSGTHGAWEIMTGAPVPDGYDAVVKVEDASVNNEKVIFTAPTDKGNNIRLAGEDFSVGDVVATAGTQLTAYHVMALATIGQKEASVYRKPNIDLFSTGKELIEDADIPLKPGQIRNSNGPYLMTALQQMGYTPHYGGMIADEPKLFENQLEAALPQIDIIISTGAVSAGKHDFIPDSLRNLDAKIVFHKVAIRPGKPILYARFSNGTHYFGLPGNPVSAAVGLRFFVTPLLWVLQGMLPEKAITAYLSMPTSKKKGLRFFRKAHISIATGGKLQLHILDGQESFKIRPMLEANSWAVLAEDAEGMEPGEAVTVYPLMPGRWKLEANI